MTAYLTEQEQLEILKNWIKQYSMPLVSGILIAILLVGGWRYWQYRQMKTESHASSVYDEMLTMRARNDPVATHIQAKKLFAHYPNTAYGPMAALMLARNAVTKKDYPEAEKHLGWALSHASAPAIRQIARLRLARVLLAEAKPEQSITLLQTVDDNTFNGLIDETKGDAYLAMKKTALARQSYQRAFKELPQAEAIRPLLQMKHDDLTSNVS